MLRNLDEATEGMFKVLVAHDAQKHLRGFDFRAPRYGIMLLILKSFDNHRELHQAKYRVQRFNDPGRRVIKKGLNPIDPV